MFEILPDSKGRRFHIKAVGQLTDADYKELMPKLAAAIKEFGPLRLLVDMESFEGWDLEAAWDDFIFGVRHWNDFERIALVGDKRWEELAAQVMDKLTRGEIRYFDLDKRGEAYAWIEGA